MNSVALGYTIIEDDPSRISAVNDAGVEICGAYKPAGHDYWALFVTQTIQQITGLKTPPHREHYWGPSGRDDSRRWIELIASLATLAAKGQAA